MKKDKLQKGVYIAYATFWKKRKSINIYTTKWEHKPRKIIWFTGNIGAILKRGKGNYQEQVSKNSRMMSMHQKWEATNPDWTSETYELDILSTPRSPIPLYHVFKPRTEYMGNKRLMSVLSPPCPTAWIGSGYILSSRIILLWPIPESHEPETENREASSFAGPES